MLKHKLTNAALSDLLHLIEIHCPRPNLCCKSSYFIKKFQNISNHATTMYHTHHYCTYCLEKVESSCCSKCSAPLQGASAKCEYVVSLEDQLTDCFKSMFYILSRMIVCVFASASDGIISFYFTLII